MGYFAKIPTDELMSCVAIQSGGSDVVAVWLWVVMLMGKSKKPAHLLTENGSKIDEKMLSKMVPGLTCLKVKKALEKLTLSGPEIPAKSVLFAIDSDGVYYWPWGVYESKRIERARENGAKSQADRVGVLGGGSDTELGGGEGSGVGGGPPAPLKKGEFKKLDKELTNTGRKDVKLESASEGGTVGRSIQANGKRNIREIPEGLTADDWSWACRMATQVELAKIPDPVVDMDGAARAVSFANLRDWVEGKGQPSDWISGTVGVMCQRWSDDKELAGVLRNLRKWPDGAYPSFDAKGNAMSQMEKAWRISVRRGWLGVPVRKSKNGTEKSVPFVLNDRR
jgi:hypothetical protein